MEECASRKQPLKKEYGALCSRYQREDVVGVSIAPKHIAMSLCSPNRVSFISKKLERLNLMEKIFKICQLS